MNEEKLVLEGKRIKLMTQERAVRSDAGVIIDYLRFTVTRDALIRAHLPAKGNLLIDGLQTDQEITEDLACYWARLLGFQPGEARAGRDFFTGERGYHDAESAYRAGGFSYQGRAPSVYQHGDFEHGQARTFQVGKRDSGKLFRGYPLLAHQKSHG